MGKSSCRLHDNMENTFTKCSLGHGEVANFMEIQRETMWVLKILLRSSQLPFRCCYFLNGPFDFRHLFISFTLLERGVTCNCNVNLQAVMAKKHVNSTVLRTPTSASSNALDPLRRQEAKPQRYRVHFWVCMAARHTSRRFPASLTQCKTKSGMFACLKGHRGNWEGREMLTEMRGVGDGTLQSQRSKAVFIKKPSETPYYENLAEKRCASDSLDLVLAFLGPKEHTSPFQTDGAGR